MYKKLDFCDFIQEFRNSRFRDYFSNQGLLVLFNYLEKLEEELKENFVFDIVTICDQFREFPDVETVLEEFYLGTEQDLRERYKIIEFPGNEGLIVQIDKFPKPWQKVQNF
jgi:hypothetical protein